jgi:hypothetical protein
MSEVKSKRDRSPAFPAIPLGEAVDKLVAFEKTFGRHAAPYDKAGLAWGLKQAGHYVAALRYFGFIEYVGGADARQIVMTEDGRNLLRAQQPSLRQELLRKAALQPREIAKFWAKWGADRPPDLVCLDELVLRNEFSQRGAPLFLRSYDDTIAFAGLTTPDKIVTDSVAEANVSDGAAPAAIEEARPNSPPPPHVMRRTPPTLTKGVAIMEGERELTTGLLSKDSSFRLLVSGPFGIKEIDRLIRKLEFDKEILADETKVHPEPE